MPYYLRGKGIRPEGVFVRQGASTVPASEAAIFDMIKDTCGDSFEDMRSFNQDLSFIVADKFFKDPGSPDFLCSIAALSFFLRFSFLLIYCYSLFL